MEHQEKKAMEHQEKKAMEHSQGPQNSMFGSVCIFITSTTPFFSVGYFSSEFSPIIPVLNTIYNQTYSSRNGESMPESVWLALLTLTISMMVVGGFFGGITTKFFLSIMSRKHVLQMCHVIHIVGLMLVALVGGLTRSYEAIIAGRFVGGFSFGVYYALVPMLMTEMSARTKQTMWQSCGVVAITLGLLCGPSLAHPKALGSIDRWPIQVALGAIPAIIYLVSSIWIPESPYYYIREERPDEAMEALRKMRKGSEADLRSEILEIKKEVYATTTIVGIKEMLTTKQYRNQLISVFAIYAGFMLNGSNNFIFYADQIFLQAGISKENVTYCTIGVFALQCAATILGTFLVGRFGGYKMNFGATILIIISLTTFTISQATLHLAPNVMPIIAIISSAVFFCSYFGGTNIASFVLLGEITIEPTRTTAFGYGAFVFWFFSWFVGFIPPYLRIALGAYSMTIWLGCTILYLIFQIFFIPDTKGKTQEEIQTHFM